MKNHAFVFAVSALFPVIAAAAVPTAFLENAEVIATGKQIRAFRVPTKDVNGNVKYYDLTINLNVAADGKFGTTAASIVSALSPTVLANQFIAGTYIDNMGATCTLSTSVLNGGRTEVSLTCKKALLDFPGDRPYIKHSVAHLSAKNLN